jgi:hypothetical protein
MAAWPMGLGEPGGPAGVGAGGTERVGSGRRLGPIRKGSFLFFEFIFNAKTNSKKV